jgi:hypothetical protein
MKTIRVRTKIEGDMEDARRRHIETMGKTFERECTTAIEAYPTHHNIRTSVYTLNLSEMFALQEVIDSLAAAGGHDDLVAKLEKITADDEPIHIKQ